MQPPAAMWADKSLSPIEEVIHDARNGRLTILVDGQKDSNQAHLIVPAQMATPDIINFMAKHGRGLICLALERERADRLRLELQPRRDDKREAFAVSIEARTGVTTGISAADRARTIAVAVDGSKDATDIVSPGHVFPLVGRAGGVLVRAGAVEAAIDIARLAGLNASSVICAMMSDGGDVAGDREIRVLAQAHGLKIGSIRDLIAYRRRYDNLVEVVGETRFDSPFGGHWTAKAYATKVDYGEHLVLIKGSISRTVPTLVRVHVLSTFTDMLGEKETGRAGRLQAAMRQIGEEESGVIVLIRDARIDAFSQQMNRYVRGEGLELRDYGIGAQILANLGIHDMILVTNSNRPIIGLEGYGLNVIETRPIGPLVPPFA